MTVAVVLFSGQSLIDRWFREGEEFGEIATKIISNHYF